MLKNNNSTSILKNLSYGVSSLALASFLMGSTVVHAEETNTDNNTVVNKDNSSNNTVTTQDNVTIETVEGSEDQIQAKEPTETTGVVIIQDIDAFSQKALKTVQMVYDFSKDNTSKQLNIPANADEYTSKGIVFDFLANLNTGTQTKKDITIDVKPNTKQTFVRLYRYTGLNTGEKDTVVKTDKSTTKDMYFVGATDKDGTTALEKIGNTPYLSTGSMYEINGLIVWCSEPIKPVTAGQKYVMKVVDEKTDNALINNFGIGYGNNTKDNYFLVDIEQGMMWEAQGFKHIFDRVMINPNNTGGIRDLTKDESAETKTFKEGIAKAIATYKSDKKANLTFNEKEVSDVENAIDDLTFEEGSVPDSIELKGNPEMLHYYKNGAIQKPDGSVLTIDDVKGTATLSKLSSLTQGDYILKLSMIRDDVQGDSHEWTADGQQTMQDYRIKNPKWEFVKIHINPKKPETPKPEEPKTPETPKSEEPKVPETPKPEEPKTPETPKTEEPKTPETPKSEEPKVPETPKPEEPKTPETPKSEEPKVPETPKPEEPKTPETPKTEEPKIPETPKSEEPKTSETPKSEKPKEPETPKSEKPKTSETPKTEEPKKNENDKKELPKTGDKNSDLLLKVGLIGLILNMFPFLKRYKTKK